MKKISAISTVVLVTTLSLGLNGCAMFSEQEPLPSVKPMPSRTITPTPEVEVEPEEIDYSISDEEVFLMRTSLIAAGDYLNIDFYGLTTRADDLPIYFNANEENNYISLIFYSEDLTKETFNSWVAEQNLLNEWIDFVPNDIQRIWGYNDEALGKQSEAGGFTYQPSEDGIQVRITIWID